MNAKINILIETTWKFICEGSVNNNDSMMMMMTMMMTMMMAMIRVNVFKSLTA